VLIDDCMAEFERSVDNLDLILPVKAKLFDLFVNGPPEAWCEFSYEWPSVTKTLWELEREMIFKYDDGELVAMALQELAEKYMSELEEANKRAGR
jgi:hypothetical protein